ncbi:bifunctional diaminohydroxyphosphoribosylaminopyrimidine deaminase/5-amino-6-(5-phosphoribosylamino)uracil reductase RibD [Dysgonomonas sp. 520]|uniref:bifunctional diaminohydroxyphosphoribosylaminopyrimidine deaminase/5-amino-6-(5-phosphoribosylamino)uracil reductase RibD n=1 Tax=Dysgonomonas sp. 520 TaxID=2302931 RepID=UPI0013D1E459|nr:bifunctional diaminohydroxyphosphoribosylaminopyrimidine deaminase/5-amino-6-(5-phosphoribosylamino)uracil reductase RibD [Dysgonomonas sp. 520]NDW08784.1 bifunctional diaminohydroxyphosphoribosylaminopyrimidine deaminase/5-amino-6-(5-phosphoribosylamino)uracil reductase RibD [Dysgonomonas sp. 520]
MNIDEKYMRRCLQLASKGRGYVSPNPMVGAVIVHDGKIIGEGYHRKYGEPHAEVNAVNSVKRKDLLTESVMYVSLEPCSHYGKTPPCAKLIIDMQIPKVVIAVTDPFPQVDGGGIKMLVDAGVEVVIGVLEQESKELNKEFFSRQVRQRPYIYLKWAQSRDGFIDKIRQDDEPRIPTPISNSFTKMLVHKKRAEMSAIMIGTNTALNDNPSLTTRLWYGKNPVRVVLDRNLKIPETNNIYDNSAQTLIFTESVDKITEKKNTTLIPVVFDDSLLPNLLSALNNYKIDSLLVEGGRQVLESFIVCGLWDEAFVEIAELYFKQGISAPDINGSVISDETQYGARLIHLRNFENHNFL